MVIHHIIILGLYYGSYNNPEKYSQHLPIDFHISSIINGYSPYILGYTMVILWLYYGYNSYNNPEYLYNIYIYV